MKMVSMKRTASSREAVESVLGNEDGEDYYPLSLYLDTEEIKKLSLDGCEVGDEKVLTIKTKVAGKSSHSDAGESKERNSLTLSVTDAVAHGADKSAADKMYGDS